MTLLDSLRGAAARRATLPALSFENRTFTYADVEGASNAAARVLRSHGVQKGDRVAICAANSLEWVLAYLGALKLGGVAVPINPAYRGDELGWILSDADPKVIVTDLPRVAVIAGLAATTTPVITIERGEGEPPAGRRLFPFYKSLQKAAVTPIDELLFGKEDALLIYTSGTTGRSKGARLTHNNLSTNSAALHKAFGWSAEDRLLLTLPLFHIHGLCVALNGSIVAGAEVRLLERFDPIEVVREWKDRQITLFMGVPTMYGRLADVEANATSCSSLRLCVSGSAPLTNEIATRFESRFGVPLLERYGMSETLITLAQPLAGPRRRGSVGMSVDGVETRVVDSHGVDVDDGGDGELWVRGASIGPGYFNNDAATMESRHEGWFKTGDIVRRDVESREIEIVGRGRDLIISGGFNIYPREVEAALEAHDDVVEAMVYGIPHGDLGEGVAATVVLRGGATVTADELIQSVRERIASYKKPLQIEFTEALPRNAMGKVMRPRIAAR